VGRLHGLVDHGQQLAVQGVQVDLVAQAGAERGDGAGGVVAAVEAAVDRGLDPAPQRLEHRGNGQGGGGHDQAGALGQEAAEAEHDPGVARPSSTVSSP
jgi:hypothetical protein